MALTSRSHRLGRVAVVSLGVVAALLLAGCSSGSFEDKAATTTAPADGGSDTGSTDLDTEAVELGTQILGQFDLQPEEIDELEAECLGGTLIDVLGPADAQAVLTVEDPTTEQLDAIEAGFDACISGRTLGPAIAALFFGELPGAPVPDQAVESCVAGEIDGATGQLIVGLFSSSDTGSIPTQFLDTLDVCVPENVVADLFVSELTADGSFTTPQAECIAEQVAPQLPISTLAQAGQSGELPPDVQALIESATASCLVGG